MSLLKQKSFSHQRIGYVSFWANFPDFQVTTFSAGTTAAWCSDHVAHHSTAVMAQWWKCHSKVLVWEMIPVVLSFSVFPKLMNYTVPLHKDCAWTPRFCICIWKNAVHPEKQGDITVARGVQLYPPSWGAANYDESPLGPLQPEDICLHPLALSWSSMGVQIIPKNKSDV